MTRLTRRSLPVSLQPQSIARERNACGGTIVAFYSFDTQCRSDETLWGRPAVEAENIIENIGNNDARFRE